MKAISQIATLIHTATALSTEEELKSGEKLYQDFCGILTTKVPEPTVLDVVIACSYLLASITISASEIDESKKVPPYMQ